MSSRITIKKNLIIFHSPVDWMPIRKRLREEYGQSINISYARRERLGFSWRSHTTWISSGKTEGEYELKYPEMQIHLDFFSDSVQSWFQLKYLNL